MSLKWVIRVAMFACCLRCTWSHLSPSQRAYLRSTLRQVPERLGRSAA